jgi:hypothetical protein
MFSESLNMFVMSDNEAFLFALKLRIVQICSSLRFFCESYLLKMLYTVIFGLFNILGTCPYAVA